jgi:hypothetical protein
VSQSRSVRRAAQRRARRSGRLCTRRDVAGAPNARPGSTLAALTSSALALSGIAGSAAADAPTDRYSSDYSFSFYEEDSLSSSKVAPGSTRSRYEIETHQFQMSAPIFERMDVSINLLYESMSGATPWFVEEGADGKPVQVMSGASVDDKRTDAKVATSYYFDNAKLTGTSGFSIEKDYTSFGGGIAGETHFNQKQTTLGGAAGFSVDFLDPTDSDEFATRPNSEEKQSVTLMASLSQILARGTAIQSSATYQYQTGFLSDPYKLVSVEGANIADSRPDERHQFTWLTRLRHRVESMNASLHLDYRFYADDWNVTSHTAEIAWYQTFFTNFRLIPSLRYYSQSQADFYDTWFDIAPNDGYASSDYRLSPYGAISWRLQAEYGMQGWPWTMDWVLSFAWERYISDADFALGKVSVENPGLVSWNLYSVRFSASF